MSKGDGGVFNLIYKGVIGHWSLVIGHWSGTPYEDLPENWSCPTCGATKDDFELVQK